jgi:glucose-1-phosphate thymidylyltransferase
VDNRTEIVGRVIIEEGAQVTESRLVGPLIIGTDAIVRDTYVGPFTSIGRQCVLADTEVEFSIVMDRSTIHGAGPIRDSLIGKDVQINRAASAPRAHRLVLGDHSQVCIP